MEKLHRLTVIALYMIHFSKSKREYVELIKPFLRDYPEEEAIKATKKAWEIMSPKKYNKKELEKQLYGLYSKLEGIRYNKAQWIEKRDNPLMSEKEKSELDKRINAANNLIDFTNKSIASIKEKL